jgi:hypothetical protein
MGTVIRTELFKPPPFLERRFKAVVEDGSAHKKGACKPQLPGDPMLDRLEFWLLLARERHFGRPAEAAGVTQPTFSSAMKTGGSSGRVRARQALSTAARRARCLCPPAMAALARLRRDWRHRSWPRLQRERGSWEARAVRTRGNRAGARPRRRHGTAWQAVYPSAIQLHSRFHVSVPQCPRSVLNCAKVRAMPIPAQRIS